MGEHLHLFPVLAHRSGIEFFVDIPFHNQAEHPHLFVRLEDGVGLELSCEMG